MKTGFIHDIGWRGKGGVCYGWEHDSHNFYCAKAVCSDKDMYSRKIGRELVLERIEELHQSPETSYNAYLTWDSFVEQTLLNDNLMSMMFPFLMKEHVASILETLNFDMLNRKILHKLVYTL